MSALYVHIPFCDHICTYCDFCKVFYNDEWANKYLEALKYEILNKSINTQFETIYIGGGTPSSLTDEQLETLLIMLEPYSRNVKEYSFEANPESLTFTKLLLLKQYGVTRISIGVQCFHDQILESIGRKHTTKQALTCLEDITRCGFNDINVDLMYGLPNQTLDHIIDDIDKISIYPISHISIYSLILEEHTQLKNKNYQPLTEEDDAHWYEIINKKLEDTGFHHYEVSNYYKTKPSFHNLKYWQYKDYEGIGLGSHSLRNGIRYENTKSLTKYLKNEYRESCEVITLNDQRFEYIMMGLRLIDGISIQDFNNRFEVNLLEEYKIPIQKNLQTHLLEIKDDQLKTTQLGLNYLNTILLDFIES